MTVTGTFPDNDWNDGCFTSVYVLTGAKSAVNQTGTHYGTPSTRDDTGTGSITTTQANSWVLGGASNPGNNVDPVTGVSGTTVLDNTGPASTVGTNFCTFYAPEAVAGTYTVGVTDTGSNTVALAEILASGTISHNTSGPSPAWVDDFGGDNTSTTGTFTPTPGSLLVAIIGADANSGHSATDIQVSDSMGLTWHQLAFGNSIDGMIMSVFVADVPGSSSPTPSLLMTGIV